MEERAISSESLINSNDLTPDVFRKIHRGCDLLGNEITLAPIHGKDKSDFPRTIWLTVKVLVCLTHNVLSVGKPKGLISSAPSRSSAYRR